MSIADGSMELAAAEGGRTTDPQPISVAPTSGAISTDQLFGASAGAAGAVIFLCMW
jgi:hypothetical protein